MASIAAPIIKAFEAACCTVIVAVCVVAVDMVATIRMVGDNVGQMPIGLFLMMLASMDSSFLTSLLVKVCS